MSLADPDELDVAPSYPPPPGPGFAYSPDAVGSFLESIGYVNEILQADTGAEQRINLRAFPNGAVEFSLAELLPAAAAELLSLLRSNQAGLWVVPLWPYALPTTGGLSAGATFIPIAPPVSGYGLELIPWAAGDGQAAPFVMLWRSPTQYSIHRFGGYSSIGGGYGRQYGLDYGQATAAATQGIKLLDAVQGSGSGYGLNYGNDYGQGVAGALAWPAGTLVVPLRVARLDVGFAAAFESAQIAQLRPRWTLEETAD